MKPCRKNTRSCILAPKTRSRGPQRETLMRAKGRGSGALQGVPELLYLSESHKPINTRRGAWQRTQHAHLIWLSNYRPRGWNKSASAHRSRPNRMLRPVPSCPRHGHTPRTPSSDQKAKIEPIQRSIPLRWKVSGRSSVIQPTLRISPCPIVRKADTLVARAFLFHLDSTLQGGAA